MLIKMLRDEIIITKKGPARMFEGDEVDVTNQIYDSLVGRGIAVGVSILSKVVENKTIPDEALIGYGEFSVTKLKAMAKEAGIKGYSSMRKNELLDAVLEAHYG